MRLIAVDRRSENHGDYTATVELKYDEIVKLTNITYEAWRDKAATPKLDALYESMDGLLQITCHGIAMPINRQEAAQKENENGL